MSSSSDTHGAFCLRCARKAFGIWKGWCSVGTEKWDDRQKAPTVLPDIPRLICGVCPQCGANEPLLEQQIFYVNYHGEGNTGLPDYFVLKISPAAHLERHAFHRKWGQPYRDPNIGRIPLSDLTRHVRALYIYEWDKHHDPETW